MAGTEPATPGPLARLPFSQSYRARGSCQYPQLLLCLLSLSICLPSLLWTQNFRNSLRRTIRCVFGNRHWAPEYARPPPKSACGHSYLCCPGRPCLAVLWPPGGAHSLDGVLSDPGPHLRDRKPSAGPYCSILTMGLGSGSGPSDLPHCLPGSIEDRPPPPTLMLPHHVGICWCLTSQGRQPCES